MQGIPSLIHFMHVTRDGNTFVITLKAQSIRFKGREKDTSYTINPVYDYYWEGNIM